MSLVAPISAISGAVMQSFSLGEKVVVSRLSLLAGTTQFLMSASMSLTFRTSCPGAE